MASVMQSEGMMAHKMAPEAHPKNIWSTKVKKEMNRLMFAIEEMIAI